MQPLAQQDLDHIGTHTWPLWEELRGQRIFITGGTGFFGCWLLESFLWVNAQLALNASAMVLTRAPAAFAAKAPHLASDPSIHLMEGDVRSFAFPKGEFQYVIHAATEASLFQIENSPDQMLSTIVDGARHVLDFAAQCGGRKLLLTSSGAVYGRQPPDLSHLPESYCGGPDPLDPRSVYGEGKRVAEQMCALAANSELQPKIARCFAFVGPGLPLDTHFAIGNFIADALACRPIHVRGDGSPYRSYLYAADLAIWLWTILLKGAPLRAYNVGSEEPISILELARAVVAVLRPGLEIHVEGQATPGAPAPRYVPQTARARKELDLMQQIGLREGIQRTAEWYAAGREDSGWAGS